MTWLRLLYSNHVLASLAFVLVLVLGASGYQLLPRSRDPEINFNWINVLTVFPGASAGDVERRITDPLEDAIRRSVQDIRFTSSTSREGLSNILVRFNELDDRTFDKRVADLRREVQNTYTDELPEEVDDPLIYEITTSNSLPAATVVVTGRGQDENLRRQSRNVKKDLEHIKGADRVDSIGMPDPELHVAFRPERLEGLGVSAADLADTVRAYFRDVSAGDVRTGDGQWLVRVEGTDADPETLARYPVTTAQGVVPLGALARVYRATEEPDDIVRFNGRPAVLLYITKHADTNILDLIERINEYLGTRNRIAGSTGVETLLVDDQTISTRKAIRLMQNNALLGLCLVLAICWWFLGTRISILTSFGIPFSLAGCFIVLYALGFTLNNSVLLGAVIALGMIVDDAVVVVDAVYERLLRGVDPLQACVEALHEVFAPVTASVLTTIAAFLPLMLLPGILGDFMMVIPLVVTVALLVSLLEAYWMVPAHITAMNVRFDGRSGVQRMRERFAFLVRLRYTQWLVRWMRRPRLALTFMCLVFALAAAAVVGGLVRFNFFASDALGLFYVNVEMPRGTNLDETIDEVRHVETTALRPVRAGEMRASVAYAGQLFTETEPLFGEHLGQIMVSLNPVEPGGRSVDEIAAAVETELRRIEGAAHLTIFSVKGGPPVQKPINVKVRGDGFDEIKAVADHLQSFLTARPDVSNLTQDYRPGNRELLLRRNGEALQRLGVNPETLSRTLQAYVDGVLVTEFQNEGEEVKVRVRADNEGWSDIDTLLRQGIPAAGGGSVPLGELVTAEYGAGLQSIRHYNFRRAVTLEGDIDKEKIDTVQINELIRAEWDRVRPQFPNVDLDFSGELDDIQESIDSIGVLFLLGVGLIYLILGTQFRSYFQPFMILITVPMAFTGVVLGLLVTRNPLSLFTLYGVVALTGVAVNSAIVMISAANDRLRDGMGLLHAAIYSARRRVIPILITSLTTIAGLFSLAAGLGGKSLVWGPVATAIVWGLAFSTVMTLFVIPLLYAVFMARRPVRRTA